MATPQDNGAKAETKAETEKKAEPQVDMSAVLAAMNARLDKQDKSINELHTENKKLKDDNKRLKAIETHNAALQSEVKTLTTSVANINPENMMSPEALKKVFEGEREKRIAAIKQPGVHGFKIHTASGKDLDPKNLPEEHSGIIA